jgi:Tol biopolymer transport system component
MFALQKRHVRLSFSSLLLFALLATALPIPARGQGRMPEEIWQFLETRIREPKPFPRHASAESDLPAGMEGKDLSDDTISQPSWSSLTFASYRDYRQLDWEIWTANGDGSSQSRRSNHAATDFTPEFDRGADRIVFVSDRDGNGEIYKMNGDGSGQTRLTWTPADEYLPAWSPDGTRIAFYSYRDGDAEIFVMNADGSNQTQLTSNGGWDGHPSWSPDGSEIIFCSDRGGQYELWFMNADGSNQHKLGLGLSVAMYPEWSPDGDRIAFNDDYNGDGWLDLAVVNLDGSGLTHPLGASPYYYDRVGPAWAPDSAELAFFYVEWINYGGKWYWVDSYIFGLDLSNNNTYMLIDSGFDWWPDWQSTDDEAPSSQVTTLPEWSPSSFTVEWSGTDNGQSGIQSYDIQYKEGAGGTWYDWIMGTTETSAIFNGTPGRTYYFQSRARDNAGNLEEYPGGNGDTHTSLDSSAPSSSASSPSFAGTLSFTVTWLGSDAESGLASFDIQYRAGPAGPWIDWLVETTETLAIFTGESQGTYYFQSRARDLVGNLEPYPDGDGDTWTLVDTTPPTSTASSPRYATTPAFAVSWIGGDGPGSGVASFDVQFRDGSAGPWTDWLVETTHATSIFVGEVGHTYYFQSRARDFAGNVEEYPGGSGDTLTTVPLYALNGHVLGNRDQAIAHATVTATPPLSNTGFSAADGAFALYYDITGTCALAAARDGYGSLPAMLNVDLSSPPTGLTFYLPPLDDRVSDGGWESGTLDNWQPGGDLLPTLAPSTTAHTGYYAAVFGGPVPDPVVTPTTPFSASATFTQTGGVLTSTWATLEIPAGAVSGTVIFTLTGIPTITGLPSATQDVGYHLAWSVALTDGTPVTTTLLPLTFTLHYTDPAWQNAQVAAEETLALWQFDPLSLTWAPLSGTLDAVSNTVTVPITTPALLALLGEPREGPWNGILQQELILSPTLSSGTLSLLYRVEGITLTSETLRVVLMGPVQPTHTVSWTLPLTVSGWVHRWWALPGWASPTLTLQLEWSQIGREGVLEAIVDEVSVGAYTVGSYPVYLPLILRAFE